MRVLVMVMLTRGRVGTLQCTVVTLLEDERVGEEEKAKDSKKRSQDPKCVLGIAMRNK